MIVYMAKINVVLAKHKHMTATQKVPTKFMDHIAVDLEGKQEQVHFSDDGYWYSKFIICTKTGMTWVRFLTTPKMTTTFSKNDYVRFLNNIKHTN